MLFNNLIREHRYESGMLPTLFHHCLLAKTVQISIRDNGLFWYQKQMKLKEPTCLASELCNTAMELLRIITGGRSIRIRGCDLIFATTPKQIKLFGGRGGT
jgi:DNA polymerase-4